MKLLPSLSKSSSSLPTLLKNFLLGRYCINPAFCDPLENPGMNKISFIYFLIKKAKNKRAGKAEGGAGARGAYAVAEGGETEGMRE